jgi:hypothetical protein
VKLLFRSWLFRAFAVLLALLGVAFYGLAEPRTSLGHFVFHAGYALPPTRPAFLGFYHWSLAEFEGGYLPSSIDQFLIDRLASCEGSAEETAIIDFQVKQSPARWGEAASREHESYQKQIIANVMPRLDDMSDEDAVSAMLLIESLRQMDPLFKGSFEGMRIHQGGNVSTLNRPVFEDAKARYKAWWGSGTDWPAIRTTDPLAGTELKIWSVP